MTEKSGVLQPMGSQRVRHDLATKQQQQSIDVHTVPLTNILYIPN